MNSVGLDNVTDESSHGNTGMLDFCLTQPTDSGLICLTPDSSSGKLKRIVILKQLIERDGIY